MSLLDSVRRVLPPKYRQFAKFLVVGGTTWVIDTGLYFLLVHTVLTTKVLTAKIIAILVAMIVNYVLNREWSFRDRGGRERHHEAALFFVLNSVGIAVNLIPLWVSRYLIGINSEHYSQFAVVAADFVSGSLIGTGAAMVFRYWAYRKWVFPELVSEVEPGDPAVDEDDFSFNVPPHLVPHPSEGLVEPRAALPSVQPPQQTPSTPLTPPEP